MLIDKGRAPKKPIEKPKTTKSRRQCVCSRCHAMRPYIEQIVPINYGINCKTKVLIDGIERVCSVCGWHVDDIETCKINKEIAEKAMVEAKNDVNVG